MFFCRTSAMPLIDKVEKSWTVYEENRPKNIQHNAPHRPQGHAPKRVDDYVALATIIDTNTAEATSTQRRNPEPPLRHPRRPQGRTPKRVDDHVALSTIADTNTAEATSTQGETRSRRSDIHAGPRAARHLAVDEARRRQPPAHSTGPSCRWNIQGEAPRGKRCHSTALARFRVGSGVSPGEPGVEK